MPAKKASTKTAPAPSRPGSIDALMERASSALLDTDYFECEKLCLKALEQAASVDDFERMSRIVMPLQEARRQKRQLATDAAAQHGIVVLDERPGSVAEGEGEPAGLTETGCYLLRPPLVGADGRELRDQANREGVPVYLLVREPTTRTGMCPVVMIGPTTVRTQVPPPDDEDAPDLAWFEAAHEALGDAAIASVPESASTTQRVNHLLERLGTVTEHEKLHQALAHACAEAAQAALTKG